MTHALTLEVSQDVYALLAKRAQQLGQPPEVLAAELLATASQYLAIDPTEVERGETVAVARNGRVVPHLVPAHRRRSQREVDEIIAEIDRVADELSARWPGGVTAQDAIDDVRS